MGCGLCGARDAEVVGLNPTESGQPGAVAIHGQMRPGMLGEAATR